MIPFAATRRSGSLCGCSKTVENIRFSAHWPKSRRSSLQRVPVQPKDDFLASKKQLLLENYEFRSWLEPQPHLGFLGRSEPETLNRPERLFNSSKTVENIWFSAHYRFLTVTKCRPCVDFAKSGISLLATATARFSLFDLQYSARKN